MAVRIQFLKETEDLSPKDVKMLTLAAKGAAWRESDKWVEQSQKQMKQMREQFLNQNVGWGMSLVQITAVERNKLWTKTRGRVLKKGKGGSHSTEKGNAQQTAEEKQQEAKKQVRSLVKSAIADLLNRKDPVEDETVARTEREQYQRNAIVDYAVAILDQEIWLRPEQRAAIHKLADETLGDFASYSPGSGYSYYAELQILGDMLHLPKEARLKELLSEEQLATWAQLKKQLDLDKQTNRFRITYRHGDMQFQFVAGRKARRR